jgi:hypothetical protein
MNLDISSFVRSLKYGCFNAYFIDILFAGSIAINFKHKSKDVLSKFLK